MPCIWAVSTSLLIRRIYDNYSNSQKYVPIDRSRGAARDLVNACPPLEGRHTAISNCTIRKAV